MPRSRRDEAASVRREGRDTGASGRPRESDRGRLRPRDTEGLRIKPRRETDGVRVRARGSEAPRVKRDAEGLRSKARDTDGVRARSRDTDGLRAKTRDADGLRAKARDTEGVRNRARGHANDTDGSRVGARNGSSLGRGVDAGRLGSPAARDRKASVRRGRMADALAGRRRAQDVDAPIDGTAALQVSPEIMAEPLKVTDAPKPPQLRVAPPAPISVPRAPFVATVLGVVVVGVLGILLINTKTNENSFRIADLEKQNAVLDNKKQDLDNQLVQASSVGNLDAAARRLGMVKVDKMALLKLPDGKIIGVPTPTDGKVSVTAQDPKGSADPDAKPTENAGTDAQQPPAGQPAAGQNGQTGQGNQNGQPAGQPTLGQPTLGQTDPGQPTLGSGQTGLGTTNGNQTGTGQTGQ
ncbi:hypothetical protein HH310_32070 [Actinoplanes sp. TBRC 11911]|uniref:hypothetical protein n=1 Tax=Actinoplanes sp. TBRC 11911 TaxID=2729386 RepID=UPI00145C4C0A|nr:hypothetical protein [Actinoplanes sp. TBRC 11911]NMO55805.1 hypothetical protein [Actinoplanes sp. TBRC 11911]